MSPEETVETMFSSLLKDCEQLALAAKQLKSRVETGNVSEINAARGQLDEVTFRLGESLNGFLNWSRVVSLMLVRKEADEKSRNSMAHAVNNRDQAAVKCPDTEHCTAPGRYCKTPELHTPVKK